MITAIEEVDRAMASEDASSVEFVDSCGVLPEMSEASEVSEISAGPRR